MTDDPDTNILPFKPREQKLSPQDKPPPFLNLPKATKIMCLILLGTYAVEWVVTMTLIGNFSDIVSYLGGFIPASWTGKLPFFWWTPLTLITFTFLHGSWLHVGINLLMLAAVGTGIEKALGIKNFLLIFIASSFLAALTHFSFSPYSEMPIVGASGGVSGLFGAILLLMRQNPTAKSTSQSMWPVIVIWIVISAIGGLMGGPNGENIAWLAHVGGFIGGIGLTTYLLRPRIKP